MIVRAVLAVVLALAPTAAQACAACLDSAFGDRGFNGAFLALMLAPFAVAAGAGGALAWLGRNPAPPAGKGQLEEGDRC